MPLSTPPAVEIQSSLPDLSEELPFTIKDLRLAIPNECFTPSTFKSLAYFSLDVGIIAGLYGIAAYLNSWLFFPIFWIVQGTMFWALFVVGHDCGHGSFSKYKWLNNLVGHLCHTPILVPYHGWRISHRTHHANTGNIDKDESWYPISQDEYDGMHWAVKFVRFRAMLLAYPIYLFVRSHNRDGSHFLPSSPIFHPSEKKDVLTSTLCCLAMITGLAAAALWISPLFVLKFYLMPYVVFVIWLDFVTYLHHTVPEMPWYRDSNWNYLKGALSTIDHDYGVVNNVHHNIGTHVIHHIFSKIPHYNLKAATEAAKPILGDYYRVSKRPVWEIFIRSVKNCHYVPNQGQTVYYQADQ